VVLQAFPAALPCLPGVLTPVTGVLGLPRVLRGVNV